MERVVMGVRVYRDPWFNLGLHVDHKALYISIHLPGFTVWIGRHPEPCHLVDCGSGRWIICDYSPPNGEREMIRNAVRAIPAFGRGKVNA